jgi:hypothetical protein
MPTHGQAPAREKQTNAVANSSIESLTPGTVPSSRPSFYREQMAKHGAFYWLLHAIAALAVSVAGAAVWDSFVSKLFHL